MRNLLIIVATICTSQCWAEGLTKQQAAIYYGFAQAVDFYGKCPFKFSMNAMDHFMAASGFDTSDPMFRAAAKNMSEKTLLEFECAPDATCALAKRSLAPAITP